jgi:hypothetical protein
VSVDVRTHASFETKPRNERRVLLYLWSHSCKPLFAFHCEADSHSNCREIPRLLWNLQSPYSVHMGPSLAPALRQLNLVCTFSSYLLNISCTNLPSTSVSPKWSFLKCCNSNFVSVPYALVSRTSQSLEFVIPIITGYEYRSRQRKKSICHCSDFG